MRNKGYVLTGFVVVIFILLLGMVMFYSTSVHQTVRSDYSEITILKAQCMSDAIQGVLDEADSVGRCNLVRGELALVVADMTDALPVKISSISCSGTSVDVESWDGETISIS